MISSATRNDRHLSEDEIDEILILGFAPDEWSEHLAACAECRAKVDIFDSSMGLFNQASLAWSEAKSNTLTRDIVGHKPAFRPHFSPRLGFAVASLVAVLVAVPAVLHHRGEETTVAYNTVPAAAALPHDTETAPPSAAEIAKDNAFLRAVDQEINAPESPIDSDPSGAAVGGHGSAQASGRAVRQVVN